MATAKPTPASSWAKKPELVTLPSGKRAHLRSKVNTYAAMRAGVLTFDHIEDFALAQAGELDDAGRAMALQDALICWLFVEPRCVLGEGKVPDGAIHIQDVEQDDLDFLIARAFGGTPEPGTFPEPDGPADERGDAADGGDGSGLAHDAEPAAGDGGGDGGGVPDRPPPRRAPRAAAKRTKPRARAARAK